MWINACQMRLIETWPSKTTGQADQGAVQRDISKQKA
jgi:hypothetical protein